jgi:hypothetical protein
VLNKADAGARTDASGAAGLVATEAGEPPNVLGSPACNRPLDRTRSSGTQVRPGGRRILCGVRLASSYNHCTVPRLLPDANDPPSLGSGS